MSLLITVAASELASFLSSMLAEGSKYCISNIWNADKNLNELHENLDKHLRDLRKTLEEIDCNLGHSHLPSDWLDELEQCRYEIEDIEDSMNSTPKKEIVTKFLETSINHVKEMQTKLTRREGYMVPRRQNTLEHPIPADEFIRVAEKGEIIGELKMKSRSSGVSLIGISGMGKTTLAKAIADEASIKSHFPCIFFPPPSSNFNTECVLNYIKVRLPSNHARVLIILDDLQSVTPEEWYHFWSECHCRNTETKVLVTTQNPSIADVTGTSKHHLHPLSDDECFLLIQNLANANSLCEDDNIAISHNRKGLVETSKGLPLLANQIGLLLSAAARGQRLATITAITTGSLWKVPDLERVLLNLKSVNLLVQNPHLKRCLAYCSLFPQDYKFEEDNLVQFWMAEGFTLHSNTRDVSYLQQTAREYFDNLRSYSLFQTSELLPSDQPSYKMHGFAYDLAQNVASKTFCRKHIGTSISTLLDTQISNITRHLALSCENIGDDEEIGVDLLLCDIQKMCSGLRTFLLFHDAGKKITKNPTFFQSLTRLRVLDLSQTNLTKLESKNISELKYLRYLDLSHTPLESLPKLSKNPELQVLKLNYCDNLRELPKDLTTLTSLISLQVNTRGLGSMPSGIGKLINLQRLDVFIVGKRKGFKIVELKNLNNLRKSLRVTKLENVETKIEAQEANLHNNVKLDKLELEWSSSALDESSNQVLAGLIPPKNLKELIIRNYSSAQFPEWISSTKVCWLLESIHLDHCKALPLIHQLPKLKTLHVEAMHEVTQMGHDLFGRNGTTGQPQQFPYIVTLILCDMLKLNHWIEMAASYMPRLCNLRVEKCQSLLQLPELDCLTSLEELQISRCTVLKELPTLPTSLKSLIVKHSDILKQRCQVGQADWPKIKGIKIEIDSEPVDPSEHNPAPAVGGRRCRGDNSLMAMEIGRGR